MPRRKDEPPYQPIRVRGGHKQSIGYARVSTADQNLERQIETLKKAGCSLIFAEHVSGAATYRPAFAAMIQAVREGDTVVVAEMDRLGRRVVELFDTLELFERTGVHFREVAHGLNTRGPHNKIIMQLFCIIAESFRAMNRERTKDGMATARKNGRVGGRPVRLTEAMRDHAQHLRSKDYSLREIAETLGVGVATVHRAVQPWEQLEMPDT